MALDLTTGEFITPAGARHGFLPAEEHLAPHGQARFELIDSTASAAELAAPDTAESYTVGGNRHYLIPAADVAEHYKRRGIALKAPAAAKAADTGGTTDATPAAVAHAEATGVDIDTVEGTGAGGRVTKGDVVAADAELTDGEEIAGT
jgi:pyruvate/2-oxoglutarate dehydrogenase complex dihydrolipoamide acyltransferase (E2) component